MREFRFLAIFSFLLVTNCKPISNEPNTINTPLNLVDTSYQLSCAKLKEPVQEISEAIVGCNLSNSDEKASFKAEFSSWQWSYSLPINDDIQINELPPNNSWQYLLEMKPKRKSDQREAIRKLLKEIRINLSITPIDSDMETQFSNSL